MKHDPDGVYIRRWLPELRLVPTEYVHEPWKMPLDVQRAAGCVIGANYPPPIVDHATAKEHALNAYQNQ
jgi:deoxyribodipyrimidine photolyase